MSKRITGVRPFFPPNLNRKTSWKDDILRDYTHINWLVDYLSRRHILDRKELDIPVYPSLGAKCGTPPNYHVHSQLDQFCFKIFPKVKNPKSSNIHTIQCYIDYVY